MDEYNFNFKEIIKIDVHGITCWSNNRELFISFSECAKRFASDHLLQTRKCVGTRDFSSPILCFTFSTQPKTNILFIKRGFCGTKLFQKAAKKSFHQLQKTIIGFGFSTYDLS